MTHRSTRPTRSIATQAAQLAVAVPQVVAHRITRMAIAGPSPTERDRREFQRMVSEKSIAFAEAWQAMALQGFLANQALAISFLRAAGLPTLRGTPTAGKLAAQVQSAALGVMGKGLAPIHRKAVANAKRLARTKLR